MLVKSALISASVILSAVFTLLLRALPTLLIYSCKLSSVNNLKLKLEVTVRDVDGNMLAFTDATTNPIIVINRDDIASDDISALDSATGIIQRNGTWKFK